MSQGLLEYSGGVSGPFCDVVGGGNGDYGEFGGVCRGSYRVLWCVSGEFQCSVKYNII